MSGEVRSVIVVEDDTFLNHAMRRMLRLCGLPCIGFSSAEEMLESQPGNLACVIIDVGLPGISGLELYRRLCDAGRSAPVVFISAYDEPEVRDRAASYPASIYLPKPFSGQQLVDAVRCVLAS